MAWEQNARNRSYTFEYDKISLLTGAVCKGAANEDYSSGYSYDKHGNMLTLSRMGMVNNKPELIDDLSFGYQGNQRLWIEDGIQELMDNSLMDFKDDVHTQTEYAYNANGAMTQDLNKGVHNITYNYLNLPGEVEIEHTTAKAKNSYTYTADGRKLKVVHRFEPIKDVTPISGAIDSSHIQSIDYVGNMIYEDGILDKILLDNGYIQDGKHYIYIRDHLGNNRLVVDAAASKVVQSTHYYPFGTSFSESIGQEEQPYKYNNKELDDRAGLNWYDYSARMKDDWSFTTIDPHAENYYSWSPYHYVANNPIRITDPTGMDWFVNNETGELIYDQKAKEVGDLEDSYLKSWSRLGDNNMFDTEDYKPSQNSYVYMSEESAERFIDGTGYEKAITAEVTETKTNDYFGGGEKPTGRIKPRITYDIETKNEKITYVKNEKINQRENIKVRKTGEWSKNFIEIETVIYNSTYRYGESPKITSYYGDVRDSYNIVESFTTFFKKIWYGKPVKIF